MKKTLLHILSLFITCIMLHSCATYNQQFGKNISGSDDLDSTNINHEIIVLGNLDTLDNTPSTITNIINHQRNTVNTPKSILFIGDNTLNNITLFDSLKNSDKLLNAIVLHGDEDWLDGYESLNKKYEALHQIDSIHVKTPLINKPINEVIINDAVTVIAIDSEWFIQNWDFNINTNQNSYLKNRDDFFNEFHQLINKNQNKIVIVSLHHPLINNGYYGGNFSAKDHLFPYKNTPLPIIGTAINFLRKTAGLYPTDTQYTYYRNLTKRLKTIAKYQSNIVFVSAHENSLQFIEDEGIKQIISGAPTKTKEARSVQPNSYTNGNSGFVTIAITKNKEAFLKIYTLKNNKPELSFIKKIIEPEHAVSNYNTPKSNQITTSIYPTDKISKSKTFQLWFGKHYRSIYGEKITAPIANFSELHGGIKPVYAFSDNKSNALIVENNQGQQFIMRRLGKSSKQFLQYDLFKDTYVKDKLNNTFFVDFVDDYYTSMHPYAPLVINSLSENLKLYHSNPQLFYVPKQNTLGHYNNTFGDALYMIEKYPGTLHAIDTIQNPKNVITTNEMVYNLEKSPKYQIDTYMYLRARLFDFLIGDWDRNPNQWLWAEKTINDTVYYQPISRDHDQAFVKIDGILIQFVNKLNPFKHIHDYKNKFPKPRFATKSAFPLDRLLLNNTSQDRWIKIATEVSHQLLTNEAITNAFDKLPKELSTQNTNKIISVLKQRRNNLPKFAEVYYKRLFKDALIIGTNQKDQFIVNTSKNKITINRYYNDSLVNIYTYTSKNTKDIWVYGLDGDDAFDVKGENSNIKLKLIGGRGIDAFNTTTSTKIFDYENENNQIENGKKSNTFLNDQYALNQFDFRKVPLNVTSLLPDLDYNRDNGIMIGLNAVYTINKFNQNPYTQKHQFKIKYSFATSGIDALYNGNFKNYSNNGFWVIDAIATTDNFTRNFFGKANLITYDKERFKDNYYRVRSSEFQLKPSYEWRGRNGSSFLIGATFESMKIEDTKNRLIDEQLLTELFDTYKRTNYLGARLKYKFENYDDIQEPTLGFGFSFLLGHRILSTNINHNNQYLQSKLNFVVPLTNNKRLTWSSTHSTEMIFGAHYHFYQMASMGSQNGLRGYRQYRFIGDKTYITSNDLRFKMNNIQNTIVPVSYGIYVGVDAGRVWNTYNKDLQWKHNYGAGFWLNTLNSFTAHVGVFNSKNESTLVNFGLGFKFK